MLANRNRMAGFPSGNPSHWPRPQTSAVTPRHAISGVFRRNKTRDMCVGFVSPPQCPWGTSLGYRKAVSPEPPFVYRGLALIKLPHGGRIRIVAYGLKSPILLEQLLQTLSSFLGACLIAECGQTEEAVAVLAEACTRGANDVGILKQVIEELP